MLAVALLIIALAGVSLRAARRELEAQATTDALTGLGNRRKLLADLERRVTHAPPPRRRSCSRCSTSTASRTTTTRFGHPPGDALLLRLGAALADAVAGFGGRAYRPGGDEFCVIADADAPATRSSRPPAARSPSAARASRSRPRSAPS